MTTEKEQKAIDRLKAFEPPDGYYLAYSGGKDSDCIKILAQLAGHKCLGFCEYDKFAVQSYRAIHNTEGEWYAKDIREVRAADVPRADVWCAGFPCQDISVAGKCLGFKGKRSSLFFAVTGLVRDLEEKDRPSYLFFENVKNILSVNRGFDFARLLAELDEIGYDAEWTLINSSDIVPQNRERVFIVGRLRGGCGHEVFPVGENNKPYSELQRFTTGTITAQGRHGVVTGGIYTNVSSEYQRGPLTEKSRTLKSNKHDAGVIIYNGREYFIRKLTPLECWRLQGWDDESFFRAFFLDKDLAHKFNTAYQRHKNRPVRLMRWAFGHQKMSDSQLYKQAGNGVTVTVIQKIAKKFSLED